MSKESAVDYYNKLSPEEQVTVQLIRNEQGYIMLAMNHPMLRGEVGATFKINLPEAAISKAAVDYLLEVYRMEAGDTRIVPSVKPNTNVFTRNKFPQSLELICETIST